MNIETRLAQIVAAKNDFVMLEFGACDGYHTNRFLELFRMCGTNFTLHSFEPEKSNFQLAENATRAGNNTNTFKLWPLAIGAEEGERVFYVSGGVRKVDGVIVDRYYGSSSIRAPKIVTQAWPDMTFTEDKVQVTTLDAFALAHLSNRPIDFIWADIQGAQVDLIRGGANTMKRVRYLYTEYDSSELYEGEDVGTDKIRELLPDFDVVEDYGGDILLHNRLMP